MADILKGDDNPLEKGGPVPQIFKEWLVNDRNHLEEWRVDARESYEFVAGRQYTDDELKALTKKKRPVVVFNRIAPVVDSVHGQEIGNRREVRYIPREMGDAKANEMLTGAAEWFRDQSNAETHESDSFWDMLICGLGWTETRIDYEESKDGKPTIDRIDPFEMFYHFSAKSRNLTDSQRLHRVRRLPLSEAKAMFPGYERQDLDASWTSVSDVGDLNKTAQEDDSGADSGDGMVTIVHCQWIEREIYYVAMDPISGEEAEFSNAEYKTANERMKQLMGTGLEGVMMRRKVRKQAFFGNVVLGFGPCPCPHKFSFQAITGKRDRNRNTWYGLVRSMKDPQRWANKWLSQTMNIMNSNSKGGLLAEKDAFEDQRKAEESWTDPSAITWLKQGALSGMKPKVQEKPPAQFPAGFMQLTEFAISSIRDTSGVSVEMLGLREAGQAASLEAQRKQAGMTILQPFFDALKYYREEQGVVMLYYIQHDLSDGRLIKISGEDGAQYVPLIKQASSEYDVIVDDAPTSPNQKEASWAIMMQLMPIFAQSMSPEMLATILEYSPLPSTIVDKLKRQAEEQQQQQAEQGQKTKELAEQRASAEVEKIQSETQKNMASAETSVGKLELEKATAVHNVTEGIREGLAEVGLTQGLIQ